MSQDFQSSGVSSSLTGECPVCRRIGLTVIRSTGLLWRHGPRNTPCPGSNNLPVETSVRESSTDSDYVPSTDPLVDGGASRLYVSSISTTNIHSIVVSHPSISHPLIKRLPRGARVRASVVLTRLIGNVVRDQDQTQSWVRLLGFASVCLARPDRGGKSRNLTTLVTRQIDEYERGTSVQRKDVTNPRVRSTRGQEGEGDYFTKRASARLEEGDIKGAMRALSSNDSLAPATSTTHAALVSLHPLCPENRRTIPQSDTTPLPVSTSDVRAAILSFPCGSAGGPDGLSPQHLKDMMSGGGIDDSLLKAVTDLVNLLLDGRVPAAVQPILFGGSLTALQKKGGGVRPIAVGYVWRRLASKVACRRVTNRAAALLGPRQMGFGVTGGCEAAVHTARQYVKHMPDDHLFLKIDFKNAFNSVRRDVIIESVARHFPELLRYVISAYGATSVLRFQQCTVSSAEGVQQGDPMGPLLFCLAVHDLLSTLKSELVLGYLDDFTLADHVDTVLYDFRTLEQKAYEIGLEMNRAKCEISGHNSMTRDKFAEQGLTFKDININSVCLLGAPLIPGAAVDNVLVNKREELSLLVSRLTRMPAHDGLFLLCNIMSMPRLLYTLRSTPCTGSPELERYDKLLKDSLSSTLNIAICDRTWKQASLPVRWGGLGIRSAVSLAPSAYIASAAGAANLMSRLLPQRLNSLIDSSLSLSLTTWTTQVEPGVTQPEVAHRRLQKAWDDPCCSNISAELFNTAPDIQTKARLIASLEDTSGHWLKALPISSIGLKLSDNAVRIAVGLRLGVNLCEPHVCQCGAQVDARGTHGLACSQSAGRHPRHGQLNDIIWRALQRAQIPSTKEPIGITRTDGKRPDGVTLIPWSHGRCLTWDVTCVDTLASSHVTDSAQRAGSAAAKAEAMKTAKYRDLAVTYAFIPVAFETLGSWGSECRSFVSELGRRITLVTNEAKETMYLKQRLSIAIQRGNAIACQGTFPQNSLV